MKERAGNPLPGVRVTVDFAGAAFAGGSRATVTDGTGRYRVSDLQPGVYSVTFALPGFRTVKHERVQITGNPADTLDATLAPLVVTETMVVRSPVLRTRVVCGMTLLPIDPLVDPGIRLPVAPGAAASMRTIAPQICKD